MPYYFLIALFLTICQPGCSQPLPENRPPVTNPAFDTVIAQTIHFSVPVIGVKDLKNIRNEVFIFDTREREEYEVSHIPGAKFLGFKTFDPNQLEGLSKDSKIVLYCSIGYRSEKIGEKLKRLGYANVYNLYGSLFEWANQGNTLVDGNGRPTNKIHTYNEAWSQWVEEYGRVEKIW